MAISWVHHARVTSRLLALQTPHLAPNGTTTQELVETTTEASRDSLSWNLRQLDAAWNEHQDVLANNHTTDAFLGPTSSARNHDEHRSKTVNEN